MEKSTMIIETITRYQQNATDFFNTVRAQFKRELKGVGELSASDYYASMYLLASRLKRAEKINNRIFNEIVNVQKTLKSNRATENDIEQLGELIVKFRSNHIGLAKQSELTKIMEKLSIRSRDAIVDAASFSKMKSYLHVVRPTELELIDKLNSFKATGNQLVFLVGNVGDGKSHLLAHLRTTHGKLFEEYNVQVLNDATESNSPSKTAMETLAEFLQPYNDANLNTGHHNAIIAINLGIITNLYSYLEQQGNFTKLLMYLKNAGVLSGHSEQIAGDDNFSVVSFLTQTNFEIENGQEKSTFYRELFNKVFSDNPQNPFYTAFKQDQDNDINFVIHQNFQMLRDSRIQTTVINLLIRAEVEYRSVISTRAILNLIHDLIVPTSNKEDYNSYLPSLIFDNENRSELLSVFHLMDPIKLQSYQTDQISLELFHANDITGLIEQKLGSDYPIFAETIRNFEGREGQMEVFQKLVKVYLRIRLLLNDKDSIFSKQIYLDFLKVFSDIKATGTSSELERTIFTAIFNWNGRLGDNNKSGDFDDYVVKERENNGVMVAIPLEDLEFDQVSVNKAEINISMGDENNKYHVTLDYRTYEILRLIEDGYILKADDHQYVLGFDNFFKEIINKTNAVKDNLLIDSNNGNVYRLRKVRGGNIKLEKIEVEA